MDIGDDRVGCYDNDDDHRYGNGDVLATPVRQFYDPTSRSFLAAVPHHHHHQQQQRQQQQQQQPEQSPLLHPYFEGQLPVHTPISTLASSCVGNHSGCGGGRGVGGGCGGGGGGGCGGGSGCGCHGAEEGEGAGTCDDSTIDTRMSASTYQTYLFEYSPSSTMGSKRLYEARLARAGVGGGAGGGAGGTGVYEGPTFVSDPYTF